MKCFYCEKENQDLLIDEGLIKFCKYCSGIYKSCSKGHIIPYYSVYCPICGIKVTQDSLNNSPWFIDNFMGKRPIKFSDPISVSEIKYNILYDFCFYIYWILIDEKNNIFIFDIINRKIEKRKSLSGKIIKARQFHNYLFVLNNNELIKIDLPGLILQNENFQIKILDNVQDYTVSYDSVYIISNNKIYQCPHDGNLREFKELNKKLVIEEEIKKSNFLKLFYNNNVLYLFIEYQSDLKLVLYSIEEGFINRNNSLKEIFKQDLDFDMDRIIFATGESDFAFSFGDDTLIMAVTKDILGNKRNHHKVQFDDCINGLSFLKDKVIVTSNQNIILLDIYNLTDKKNINCITTANDKVFISADKKFFFYPQRDQINSKLIFCNNRGNSVLRTSNVNVLDFIYQMVNGRLVILGKKGNSRNIWIQQ
ncbi:MAG: hypothetical protein JW870_11225 [Candidatus Delongbacteria bacterium]|nr:hypothetical protein [Candidatus Delongbacteria bacterium]